MRATRILASVIAVVAFSALTAAQAAATPEFNAAKYPVGVAGNSLNQQGFAGTGISSNCKKATASTEEEGIKKPEKNSPTLEIHPVYSECILTLLGTTGGKANVITTGCNYVFHAVAPAPPANLKGTTDIKCASTALANAEVTEKSKIVKVASTAGLKKYEIVTGGKIPTSTEAAKQTWIENVISGTEFELSNLVEGAGIGTVKETVTVHKDIQVEATFLAGCSVFVPEQKGLGFLQYENKPAGEVTLGAEVEKIQTGIASVCGTGKIGTTSEYREGKEDAKEEIAELCTAKPCPANFQSKGTFGVEADYTEVGINEAHWTKNKALIPASAEGLKVLMWGNVKLENAKMGGECQTLWGGNVLNKEGGGGAPLGGMAAAGETKIASFGAYDCESPQCLAENAESKLSVAPEGLFINVEGGKAVQHQWEGKTSGNAPVVNIGTGAEATQVKWKVECPKTAGTTEYKQPWTGELKTAESEGFVGGTAVGSSPAKLGFGAGPPAAELSITGLAEKGKVTSKLKMMGYEGGEEIGTQRP